MKGSELRNESPEELDLMLENLKKEIFELRSQKLDSKSQKTHLIAEKRKDIARILTLKREMELKENEG